MARKKNSKKRAKPRRRPARSKPKRRAKKKKRPKVRVPKGLVVGRELRMRLGVSERTWHRWVSDGMPQARRGRGSQGALFNPAAAFAWYIQHKAAGESKPTSPALEELRRQKAMHAARENAVEEAKLLDADMVRLSMREVAQALRSELYALERVHGRKIGDAIREMLERADEALVARFGGNGQ